MRYFITGITGAVVPFILEGLFAKDENPFFYLAIRKDAKGNGVQDRFESVLDDSDLDAAAKDRLRGATRLVEIDIEKERIGIAPDVYAELVENVDKILHAAADVRFDQPYEKIRVVNVAFTEKIYDLFSDVKAYRQQAGKSSPVLYYMSTSYSYGIYNGPIPEDFPDFKPGKPDNTYAQTKAEAKAFILDHVMRNDDQVVIFEPTIIGGSAKTGKTRKYNLFYVFLMLGFLGRLPFLTERNNRLDIVPVDWVADVVSDIMTKNGFSQGVIRLAAGENAITNGELHDIGYHYYVDNNPVEGHVIPPIRFVPRHLFFLLLFAQKNIYRALHLITRKKRYSKLVRGIGILEGYVPYMAGNKRFQNDRSNALIAKYTDCGPAPVLQDRVDEAGNVVKGYMEKLLSDTLDTGWGGMVDYKRLEKKSAVYKEKGGTAQAAYGYSKK